MVDVSCGIAELVANLDCLPLACTQGRRPWTRPSRGRFSCGCTCDPRWWPFDSTRTRSACLSTVSCLCTCGSLGTNGHTLGRACCLCICLHDAGHAICHKWGTSHIRNGETSRAGSSGRPCHSRGRGAGKLKGFKEPFAMGIKVIPYKLADCTFLSE